MALIGNQNALAYTSFAKQDFTVTATTSYTLDHSVSNENEIALFINFVRQEPTTAYTASGTSLTLTEATSVGDDMYCVFIGKAVQTVTPASSTITNDMIVDGTIAESKLASGVNTITMADQWRLTASTNSGTNADVTTNWERVDNTGWGSIGTGLTESSGIFSFAQTGVYLINFVARGLVAASDTGANFRLLTTTDNSNYSNVNLTTIGNTGSANAEQTGASFQLFDVTNITTHKFKFETQAFDSGTRLDGNTDITLTGFLVIRLGDT